MSNQRIKFDTKKISNIIDSYTEDAIITAMLSSSVEERLMFYKELATKSFEKKEIKIAEVAIERALLLSNYDESLLDISKVVLEATRNSKLLRETYKRIGLKYLNKGDIENACLFFDKWQYTDAVTFRIDQYNYDIDILNAVSATCELKSFNASMPKDTNKIKVGYIVNHITAVWSALMRAAIFFAKYHDKSIIEIHVIIVEPYEQITNSVVAQDFMQQLEALGCKITYPNNEQISLIYHIAKKIFDLNLHILISLAALSNFAHYAILSYRPAPIIAGALGGPIPQYISLNMDFAFSWLKHPTLDSPIKCYYILMEDKPKADSPRINISKIEIGIPPECCLLMMAGRFTKFQNLVYWENICKVLTKCPNTYLLILGVKLAEIPFLEDLIQSQGITNKIRFIHWLEDYIPTLACADIFIDTYPAGGGGTILDAAGLKIPVVSFDSNYMEIHSQMNWRLADELFGADYEGIIPIDDYNAFHHLMDRLIGDESYRIYLGALAYKRVYERHNYTTVGIKQLEKIFLDEVQNFDNVKRNLNQSLIDLLSNNGTFKHLLNIFKTVIINKFKKKTF